MRIEDRGKLIAARFLVTLAVILISPLLLIAGAPIYGQYVRYIYRDGARLVGKENGQVSFHYFVILNPIRSWLCKPTSELAWRMKAAIRRNSRNRAGEAEPPA